MKFGSSASAWTKKAASAFRAAPPWPSATRKWAAALQPKEPAQQIPLKVASTEATTEIVLPTATIEATIKATGEATEVVVTVAPATVAPTEALAATEALAGASRRLPQRNRAAATLDAAL